MYRTYNYLKFNRTYIGDSKQNEINIFNEIQGNDEENCDWIKYRRILIQYFEDTIHVIFSWKKLIEKISIISMFLSIVLLHPYLLLSVISIIVSILSILISLMLKNKLKKWTTMFEFSISFINNEIKKRNGFVLPEII